jgi:hypothetical protein
VRPIAGARFDREGHHRHGTSQLARSVWGGRQRPPSTRHPRTIAVATVLFLSVAAGTAVALRSGLLSFGTSCQDDAVRLRLAASPGMAPTLRAAAQRSHDADATSDGRCIAIRVTARDSSKVADALLAGRRSSEILRAIVAAGARGRRG